MPLNYPYCSLLRLAISSEFLCLTIEDFYSSYCQAQSLSFKEDSEGFKKITLSIMHQDN